MTYNWYAPSWYQISAGIHGGASSSLCFHVRQRCCEGGWIRVLTVSSPSQSLSINSSHLRLQDYPLITTTIASPTPNLLAYLHICFVVVRDGRACDNDGLADSVSAACSSDWSLCHSSHFLHLPTSWRSEGEAMCFTVNMLAVCLCLHLCRGSHCRL